MGLQNGHVGPPLLAVKLFSCSVRVTIGDYIESALESGCGLSHKSTQDGCNGTCVRLEASKPEV